MLDSIEKFVKANVAEHLQGLWTTDIETQLMFKDGSQYRIPKDGNGEPRYHDHDYHPPFDNLEGIGVTGWDWTNQRSLFVTVDLDSIANHAGGHDQATLDSLVERVKLVEQAEIIRSKSGKGYHLRLYFDPEAAPRAYTRAQHITNCTNAFKWLAEQVKGLEGKEDATGVVAWIYHTKRGPNGMELLKRPHGYLPAGWDLAFALEVKDEYPAVEECPVTPKHETLIKYLTDRKWGEWQAGRLQSHTYNLSVAAEDKSLGIVGTFATIATGKGGPDDRNCFLHPAEGGSWRVYRHHKNTKEHSSWWKTENGWTTTFYNKGKEAKGDPAAYIFNLALADDLFHDKFGTPYVTTKICGIKETFPVKDSRYRYSLRLRYTEKTGRIVSAEHLKNAIDQVAAEAVQKRPEYPVAIRLAAYDGAIYIDLSDRERRVVKVTGEGYELVENPPVRFHRNHGQLPLPIPLPGGSIEDVRPFVNVDPEDEPLLLGLMIGAFDPCGPYTLGQIVGEKGSAKTSLSRFVHDFIDPNMAVGNVLPNNAKDMLVVAKNRWLVSFDNISDLPRKTSDLLAMLVTGSAFSSRKLFTDDEQSMMTAKRPVILTSIANVVEASDLLDRTLTLFLPTIPPEQRKTEFALNQELMRKGVRGRIFGYLLNGVVSAIANQGKIKLDRLPRMGDFVTWCTAAEPGLGLPSGSIQAAFERCQQEQSGQVTDSTLAKKVMEICDAGFKGTATELAARVRLGLTVSEFGSQLREIAPDIRRAGYIVKFGKSNGSRYVELGREAKA